MLLDAFSPSVEVLELTLASKKDMSNICAIRLGNNERRAGAADPSVYGGVLPGYL